MKMCGLEFGSDSNSMRRGCRHGGCDETRNCEGCRDARKEAVNGPPQFALDYRTH